MKGWVDQGAQIDAPTWDSPGRPDTGEKFLWGCESCCAWLRWPTSSEELGTQWT